MRERVAWKSMSKVNQVPDPTPHTHTNSSSGLAEVTWPLAKVCQSWRGTGWKDFMPRIVHCSGLERIPRF